MHNHSNTAVDQGASDGIRYGRRAPTFTPVPEWVIVAGLSPQALALYTLLLAHVNRTRGDGVAWPGMETLRELLGFKQRKSIQRYLAELVMIGAVEVERMQASMVRRNVYVVNELPPAEHVGPQSLTEFYRARQTPTSTPVPLGRGTSALVATATPVPMNQTNATTGIGPDEMTSGDTSVGVNAQAHRPRIELPHDFAEYADGDAYRYLTGAAVAALRKVGMTPAGDAGRRIGGALKLSVEQHGMDRAQLVAALKHTLALAGTDNPNWGSLATWQAAA